MRRYESRLQGDNVPSNYSATILTKDGSTALVTIDATDVEYDGKSAGMTKTTPALEVQVEY